jgi:hypothetical protein
MTSEEARERLATMNQRITAAIEHARSMLAVEAGKPQSIPTRVALMAEEIKQLVQVTVEDMTEGAER